MTTKKKLALLFIFCLLSPFVKAQVSIGDSLAKPLVKPQTKAFRMSPYKVAVGGSLLLAGSLIDFDHGGRKIGGQYHQAFSCKADEVLRFVPTVALMSMKLSGIKGRTKTFTEQVIRSAASLGIMTLGVNITKKAVGRVRPDGSDDQSFPSGHAATAFLTATVFAKEFEGLSYWYPVGAYGLATTTALLRRTNDKHWMSDVMAGAGIGILSAELGYALMDLCFEVKDNNRHVRKEIPSSMAGVYMKYVLPKAINGPYDNNQVRSRLGYEAGMEVKHFFHNHFGIGGRLGISSSQMEINGKVAESPLDHVNFMAGPHIKTVFFDQLQIGGHLHGGYGFYPQTDIPLSASENIVLGGKSGWGYEGGISVSYLTRKNVIFSLIADYLSWSNPASQVENKGLSFGLSAQWGW